MQLLLCERYAKPMRVLNESVSSSGFGSVFGSAFGSGSLPLEKPYAKTMRKYLGYTEPKQETFFSKKAMRNTRFFF